MNSYLEVGLCTPFPLNHALPGSWAAKVKFDEKRPYPRMCHATLSRSPDLGSLSKWPATDGVVLNSTGSGGNTRASSYRRLGTPYPDVVRLVKKLVSRPELGKQRTVVVDATGVGARAVHFQMK
jgi:hypothetical protein